MVFSSSRDKLIKVWKNDHTEQPLQVMSGHTLGVSSIAASEGEFLENMFQQFPGFKFNSE